jgi:3-hydroxybutyryl-CoA dehydrogenase
MEGTFGTVRTFGVLGTGTMGAGIAQLAAGTGHEVVACDRRVESLERAQLSVRDGLSRLVRKDVLTEKKAGEHYARIHWTTDAGEFSGCDAVIEVITEKVEPKKEALAALDALISPGALLLTNTSSISVTDLAGATQHPERVCGAHFFTPPPVREAVEVPVGALTSEETVGRVQDLIRAFGKLPVVVRGDAPGFVANRFLIPMLIEGARLLEQGVATREEIDLLVKKGLGFPIGPFELADLVGIDVGVDVMAYVHEKTGEPYYVPPRLLEEMVRDGRLGRKTGRGFYDYDER